MAKAISGVKPTEWAKHLRPDGKRAFWKRHRKVPVLEEHFCGTNKKAKKKKYGLRITYSMSWLKPFTIVKWYGTEKARTTALKKMSGEGIER